METTKRAKRVKLTKTQKSIFKQLSENTGAHMCDSGGAYGRNYDKYKDAPDFSMGVQVNEYGCTIPVHVYMNAHLERSDLAIAYERAIKKSLKRMKLEYPNLCYSNQDEIAEVLKYEFGLDPKASEFGNFEEWTNTYNYDNDLSQVLQYVLFEIGGKCFAIIETHNGCDVRGGYSDGVVYEIGDVYEFILGQKITYTVNGEDFESFDYDDWKFDAEAGVYKTSEGEEVSYWAHL